MDGMDLKNMSVAELESAHQELDRQVAALRDRQGAIHAETVRQEQMSRKVGDPRLLQSVGFKSAEQVADELPESKARELFEALAKKLGLGKKEE